MKHYNEFLLFFGTLAIVTFSAEGKINCDKLGMNFYNNIGCTGKNTGGDCPSYKDCKYERQPGTCRYNGVVIKHGDYIGDDQDILCSWSCSCRAPSNTKGTFSCAQGQCGHFPVQPNQECYTEYELGQCCGKQRCEPSTASCTVDGKTYKEGEQIYAKDECSICICTSEFNGKFEGPHCKRRACDVEVRHTDKIEEKCAPVYFKRDPDEVLCCPQKFICPSDTEDKFTIVDKTDSDVICEYGNKTVKAGERLTRTIEDFAKMKTVTCECKLPPLLTCTVEDYNYY